MTTAMAGGVSLRRGYTECRFGQMHYLESLAEGVADAPAGPARPTLVLLHQNPSTSVEYEPLARALGRDRRVIAFDTSGYGMSDAPPRPLSIPGYAAAFGDAFDVMGLARDGLVDVFGYHSGAFLAAELGLQRPDAVRRLVLCGVPLRSPEECAERLESARTAPRATEDGAALMAQSAALWSYVVTRRDPRMSLERATTLFAEKNKPLDRASWVYEGVWSYPARDRLPAITQPTLFLQPHDMLMDETRAASALVPHAALAELPDLDRDIFDVGADAIAACVRDFLSSPTVSARLAPETMS